MGVRNKGDFRGTYTRISHVHELKKSNHVIVCFFIHKYSDVSLAWDSDTYF